MTAGVMTWHVAIEAAGNASDGLGGTERAWQDKGHRWAEVRFVRGQESPEPGGQSGSAVFKCRLWKEEITRNLTTADRIVDLATGEAFNIRAVDTITDRQSVWLDLTGGVAT